MNLRTLAILLVLPLLALSSPAHSQDAAKEAPAKKDVAKKKSDAKADPKKPLAKVNGVPVPQSRLELLLQQQRARGAQDNEQTRAMIRNNLIDREVVMQAAQKAGVARSPAVQSRVDFARQQILIDAYFDDWLRKHPVTDAEIQKEYDRVKILQGSKEYKARHILVNSEEQAKTLIAELQKGAKLEELAAKHSQDPGSKENGGELDWSIPSIYDKQFADAMVKLEKGKYTEAPVRTRFGYHVIQLDDVREFQFPALDDAKPRIREQLMQNRVEARVKELRAKAVVE